MPRCRSLMVTVAPAKAAPVGSVTVPRIRPALDCATGRQRSEQRAPDPQPDLEYISSLLRYVGMPILTFRECIRTSTGRYGPTTLPPYKKAMSSH